MTDFTPGDYVEKYTGEARWLGTIVARYHTMRGKLRYVVDVDPQGFQMIAVPSQLRRVERPQTDPFAEWIAPFVEEGGDD